MSCSSVCKNDGADSICSLTAPGSGFIRPLVTDATIINGIGALAGRYDALLCDAWGVIHNGVELFPGAGEAMEQFRAGGGTIVILTNAPRPSSIIPAQLSRLGLSTTAYDDVVTSGDSTRAEIEQMLPAPAFRIGPAKDDPLFEELAIEFAPLERAEFIICTGLENDHRDEPEDYRDLLTAALARGLPMICANPDIVVNWGGRMIWCAGATAEIYEKIGGKVIYGGKPHAPIYRLAMAAITAARGKPVEKNRILAIGDGLKTDIGGANAAGVDALFVSGSGGIHVGDGVQSVGERLHEAGVRVIGVTEALRW